MVIGLLKRIDAIVEVMRDVSSQLPVLEGRLIKMTDAFDTQSPSESMSCFDANVKVLHSRVFARIEPKVELCVLMGYVVFPFVCRSPSVTEPTTDVSLGLDDRWSSYLCSLPLHR